MFLIAKEASLGMVGLCLMICNAKSLIESMIAEGIIEVAPLAYVICMNREIYTDF